MVVTYQAIYSQKPENNRIITESIEKKDFYATISKWCSEETDFPLGSVVRVFATTADGKVVYQIRKRGGTICINEMENTLPDDYKESKEYQDFCTPKYLTWADPADNKYRQYIMEPYDESQWKKMSQKEKEAALKYGNIEEGSAFWMATYGRIGESVDSPWKSRSCYYPITMFMPKYDEKISKGYKDFSDIYFAENIPPKDKLEKISKKEKAKSNTHSKTLFDLLRRYSTNTVKESEIKVRVTWPIIQKSKELVESMRNATSVDEFNKYVLDLIVILQRPLKTGDGSGVRSTLANSKEKFAEIIAREESLIQAMEGSIDTGIVKHTSPGDFSDYGIEVYEATEKQKAEVMRKLSDTLKSKVKKIYRVIPLKQKEYFNDYLNKNGIKDVKLMWHGSKNENWMSIIQNSLQLNPNAVITGKMFGHGIYFAPSSLKSWNYTSIQGSYWANGSSNTAFMGLYAVAYGKPYDVYSHSYCDYESLVKTNGCNCLHAHKDKGMLKNDEIVFYYESAVLLDYIVEFKE